MARKKTAKSGGAAEAAEPAVNADQAAAPAADEAKESPAPEKAARAVADPVGLAMEGLKAKAIAMKLLPDGCYSVVTDGGQKVKVRPDGTLV